MAVIYCRYNDSRIAPYFSFYLRNTYLCVFCVGNNTTPSLADVFSESSTHAAITNSLLGSWQYTPRYYGICLFHFTYMIEFQPNETILCSARKHWLIFTLESAGLILGALFPVGGAIIMGISAPDFVQYTLGIHIFYSAAVFITAAWWLILFIILATTFTNYYLDILIVTNQRIIDIEQLGLFARDVTSAPLQNIEDIKVEVTGILPSLLDFGNLHIQTAAAMREIVVYGIHSPNKMRDCIAAAHAQIISRTSNKIV